ncbi:putative NTE family protein [Meiothermus luteus]|uniref:Putative NTE family protein n=1 Tax=Meiothermus luteus TaxID=2026184 RepID=A0A399ESJ1_9DEIN|nr:patatin-like phospholipase family protein [Meiothermus luteus]RIH86019.1 putative NTE family protein [Meiothermus luteus]RMH55281.1 MAG: patatin-like phospholipase family protein [Deinococcota bacterium]
MRGLVLSGGGARGLAHIGVLEVLEAQGFEAEVVAGTSMGAVVGALYASGKRPGEILEIARSTPWLRLLDLVPRPGLISQRALREFLARHLPPRFEHLKRRLVVTAVDLEAGRLAYFTEGDLPGAVLASAAYPGLVAPVQYQGRTYVDGGVLDNLPVDAARFMQARYVLAVDVTPEMELFGVPRSSIGQIRRAIDIMQSHLTAARRSLYPPEAYIRPDLPGVGLEQFGRLEEIVDAGRRAAAGHRLVRGV